MEGNNSYKQTNKTITLYYGARLIPNYKVSTRQFQYLPDDQKVDSENIDVLLLENVKEQEKNNEMPKGVRLDKTEQDIAFR